MSFTSISFSNSCADLQDRSYREVGIKMVVNLELGTVKSNESQVVTGDH